MSSNECEVSPTTTKAPNVPLPRIVRPSLSTSSSIWSQESCSSRLSCDFKDPYPSNNVPSISIGRCKQHTKNASPAKTINAIMLRRPSVLNMETERRVFGHGLEILEPRPLIYWGGMEETMGLL